jgi:RimJ/RimL family protein N-acetyltransferase
MARQHPSLTIALEPWTAEDMPLLRRLNEPAMTEHLGGPETQAQLERRLHRYVLSPSDTSSMFKVMVEGGPAGSIGFWEREWRGDFVYETGWSVLPEYQGRGVASRAIELLIPLARAAGKHDAMHAFPGVENGPSNAICRKAGFELLGPVEFEYPKGHWAMSNDWRLSLR